MGRGSVIVLSIRYRQHEMCTEKIMFACILILILFLPVAFLPCVLGTFFSLRELKEMGIHLEELGVAGYEPNVDISAAPYCLCM